MAISVMYRHRFGLADGDPRYADIERKLAAQPAISVPSITLDRDGDGVSPATDGSWSAPKIYAFPRPSRGAARRT